MNLVIRKAELKDATCIAEAEREIAERPGYFCSQPSELSEEAVKQMIESTHSIYLVAEYEGQIVGHAFLEPFTLQSLQHVADLNIAVNLGWQKKGIGTKLLRQLLLCAKKSDVLEKIQLNVRASNAIAISLYKKFGFQEEGRLKNRLKVKDAYIDDIIMGLDLKNWIDPTNRSDSSYIVFRNLQEEDLNKIAKTFTFPWSGFEATLKLWEQWFKEQQKGIRTVCVLEKNSQFLGYGSLLRVSEYPFFRENHIPDVNAIWIDETFRKQGLGRKLIEHLENMARLEGYQTIGIGVGLYKDYGPAQKLYFKMGYQPDGNGVTYKGQWVVPGTQHPVDDDLLIWLSKPLSV